MTLVEFHDLVRTSLRRGTTLDAVFPTYAKLAGLWLERNYNFKYMEQFRLLQLVEGDRTVNLPSNKIVKGISFIRLIDDDSGEYTYLRRVNPRDLDGTETSTPTAYWVSGVRTVVFNNTPDEALSGEAVFLEFTDWPTGPSETHTLFDIGTDVLLYQTLIHMAGFLRDADMVAAYKQLRDDAIITLLLSEDEQRFHGEAISMAYSPLQSQ